MCVECDTIVPPIPPLPPVKGAYYYNIEQPDLGEWLKNNTISLSVLLRQTVVLTQQKIIHKITTLLK